MKKLFVGGLSWGTTDEGLHGAFTRFGEIVEAKVITDRETGRSRGFGFVTFAGDEAAATAITEMDGSELDGRTIKVNEAEDKGPRGGGGGGGGGGGYGRGGGRGGKGGGRGGRAVVVAVAGAATAVNHSARPIAPYSHNNRPEHRLPGGSLPVAARGFLRGIESWLAASAPSGLLWQARVTRKPWPTLVHHAGIASRRIGSSLPSWPWSSFCFFPRGSSGSPSTGTRAGRFSWP